MRSNITIDASLEGKVIVEERGVRDGVVYSLVTSDREFLVLLSIDGQSMQQSAVQSSTRWTRILYLKEKDSANIVDPEQQKK